MAQKSIINYMLWLSNMKHGILSKTFTFAQNRGGFRFDG